MSGSVRFGFIGCGEAAGFHAQAARALGHTIQAAAARPNSPRLEPFARAHAVRQTYTDWRLMLARERLEALVVATSWDQTEQLAAEALAAGLPVLFEKPLALSVATAEALLAAAGRRAGSVLVGYNRRFYDFMPWVRSRSEQQPPLSVQLQCPDALEAAVRRHGPRLREHALLYKTSHWIDLAAYLLGGPLEVMDVLRRQPSPACHALLSAPRGVPVHLAADFDAPAPIAVTVTFRDMVCQLRPAEMLRVYEGMEVQEATAQMPVRRYEPRVTREQMTDARCKPGVLNQLRYFIDVCVRHSAPAGQGCHLEDAVELTRLCERLKTAPHASELAAGLAGGG